MLHGWRIGHSPEHKKNLQQKKGVILMGTTPFIIIVI